MKKIALMTIYQVPNFGSVLQTYATQLLLTKLGYECKIIKYKYPNEWHFRHGWSKPSLKNKIAYWINIRSRRKLRKLELFRNQYFNFTKIYNSLDELIKEDWSDYNTVVAGSDQIWNPRFLKCDTAFMLSFLPDNIKRISIASSFASANLDENEIKIFKKYLTKFSALSVRETNGINIIKNNLNINKNIPTILDPTLLINKEEWLTLLSNIKIRKQEKYIIFYMLDYAFNPKPYIFEVAKFFKEKLNAKILAISGYSSLKKNYGLNMINYSDITPNEFIYLFNNCDLVITSSFHGTAFAINFGKPLISVIPSNSQDDRQTSLLKSLGLNNCLVPINTPLTNINPYYDKDLEQLNLEALRKTSINWIKQNL